jgi:undecaprenyl-diphosphatase
MTWWQAVFLGALQGVTEFLPISSSGHLVLFQHFFGMGESDTAQELFFDGVLHLGTLLAVVLYFRRDLLRAGPAATQDESQAASFRSYRDWFYFLVLIGLATIPAVAVTLVKSDAIKESFKLPRPVAINFLFLGALLLLTDRLKPGTTSGRATRWWQALLIGCAQAVSAILRGMSRSGSTIAMSLLVGLERTWAVRFSFMLSVVASLGLGLLGIYKGLKDPLAADWLTAAFLTQTAVATLVSAAVGYATIGPLIALVRRARLAWFAIYLWIVGIGTLVVLS